MNYVGIDTSKADFHACFGDSTRRFPNDTEGYRALARAMRRAGFSPADTEVGTEATGAYHLPMCAHLSGAGWTVRVINPLLTNRLAKSRIRQAKTDRIDAGIVRRSLAAGDGRAFGDISGVLALKSLVAMRNGLVRSRTEMRGRLEAQGWKDRASGADCSGHLEAAIRAVSGEIKAVEARFRDYAKEEQDLLRSIPGIGQASAAALVATVGDIRKFPSPKKLVAFVGLDCRTHESGSSVRGKGHITKRGDRDLRHALFMAAFHAVRGIPELREFYDRKRDEGKHHFSALCAAERKLVHIVWAVWTRGTPFEQRKDPS